MTGLEVAVGFLIAWAGRKAARVGNRADKIVDDALDAGLDRVHEVVLTKLSDDPALTRLTAEAESGEVSPRTAQRVELALAAAAEDDPQFADQLRTAVEQAQQSGATVNAAAHRGISIGGDNTGIASSGDGAVNIQHR